MLEAVLRSWRLCSGPGGRLHFPATGLLHRQHSMAALSSTPAGETLSLVSQDRVFNGGGGRNVVIRVTSSLVYPIG